MNERRQQRVEEPERGKSDADRVHRDCAYKISPDDSARAARDA